MRIVIVGAGALGVHHALAALDLGWEVQVIERDERPRSASVRNFGLVWCSGRRAGPELELALDARERWEKIGARFPEIGFRPSGSITLARRPDEVEVLEEYASLAPSRGLDVALLGPAEIRAVNPALAGDAIAGVLCRDDAVVEPRLTAPALLDRVEEHAAATVLRATQVLDVDQTSGGVRVLTDRGAVEGDAAVLCPGAEYGGPFAALLTQQPIDRCQLQMFETAPLSEASTTPFADGDSLRYYPGFAALESASRLEPAEDLVQTECLQLLVAPRLDGGLTVGDSHRYEEPFAFDLDERITAHLLGRLEALLGSPPPPIVRRWSGVYSRYLGDEPYLHLEPLPGVHLVTGVAGKGMTVSPAVAGRILEELR